MRYEDILGHTSEAILNANKFTTPWQRQNIEMKCLKMIKILALIGSGPLAKIISLRGNPLGNRFSVIQCVVPWILDYHKKFPSKKLAKHRENG
jgi:hypothetical protein